ncbi:TolB family protein [Streptomyces fildesensis]|uniref:TolB family protein n=1 Tax=Streptomyces fildesensis TaxID=375757 RepID=A0ABW8C708_9ACTN
MTAFRQHARFRLLAPVVALLVLAGLGVGYSVHAARREAVPAFHGEPIDTARPGQLLFRDTAPGAGHGNIAAVPAGGAGAPRTVSGLNCERFYSAAGTGVCLVTSTGAVPRTYALIVDRQLREVRRVKLSGIPNRARVSPSGRMVSWTVFVQGDSYNRGGFSTWTGILDTRTGYAVLNIEDIPLFIDGHRYRASDVNFWGVTFAADDNRFYATVTTKGKTYLVQGDYGKWEAHTLRENAECPSLSPDGTRVVFKKRVSSDAARPWRLHVLDLSTMRETPLAEPASVDDQAAWFDEHTVMYARSRGKGGSDVWAVPADGTGRPRELIVDAASPSR